MKPVCTRWPDKRAFETQHEAYRALRRFTRWLKRRRRLRGALNVYPCAGRYDGKIHWHLGRPSYFQRAS